MIPDDTLDRLFVGKATDGDQMLARNAILLMQAELENYRWLKANVSAWTVDHGKPHVRITIYMGFDDKGRLLSFNIGPRDAVGMISLDTAIARVRRIEKEQGDDL